MIEMCDNGDADSVRRNLFNTTITDDLRMQALQTLDEFSTQFRTRLANYEIIGVEKLLDKDGRPIPLTAEAKRLIEEAQGIKQKTDDGPLHNEIQPGTSSNSQTVENKNEEAMDTAEKDD